MFGQLSNGVIKNEKIFLFMGWKGDQVMHEANMINDR